LNILALDTAGPVLSVALETQADAADGESSNFWYTEVDAGRRHSEFLMACADWLCKSAGIKPENLDIVACMQGPGSFTGLRIGFSAAKGIALALGIPLVAISTLDCMAAPLSFWPGITLPAMDAKKGCFFTALYRQGQRLTTDMDAPPESIAAEIAKIQNSTIEGTIESIVLTGCGAHMLFSRLAGLLPQTSLCVSPDFKKGRSGGLLKIAKYNILHKDKTKLDRIYTGPVYLRKSDAELHTGKAKTSL